MELEKGKKRVDKKEGQGRIEREREQEEDRKSTKNTVLHAF